MSHTRGSCTSSPINTTTGICHLIGLLQWLHHWLHNMRAVLSNPRWCDQTLIYHHPPKLLSFFPSWNSLPNSMPHVHSFGCNPALAKWILESLGIRGVNFHGEFGLGIPNYNSSGSKKPRNSQKFQVYSQQGLEFLGITTQSTNDFPWKVVNLKNS